MALVGVGNNINFSKEGIGYSAIRFLQKNKLYAKGTS